MKQSVIDNLTKELNGVFELYAMKVEKLFSQARRKETYYSVKDQNDLKTKINKQLTKLRKDYKSKLLKSVNLISKESYLSAYEGLKSDQIVNRENIRKSANKYTKAFITEQFKYVSNQINKMKYDYEAHIKADQMKISNRAMIEGISKREANKILKDHLIATDPYTTFIDKRFRRWKTQTYFQMFAKTVLNNIYNDIFKTTMLENNRDLVKISSHNAIDRCRPHEGKIISLSGATEGYQTYDELKASGDIFHPRCKHRLLMVSED